MPPGTTPTYSNCSEFDMRRPWQLWGAMCFFEQKYNPLI